MEMEWQQFVRALGHLSGSDIVSVGEVLRARSAPADDVEWWKLTLATEQALRRAGRSVEAALAAQAAAAAVRLAAERSHLLGSHPDVIAAARSAADAARALVAQAWLEEQVDRLLRPWKSGLAHVEGGGGQRHPAA